MLMMIMLMIVIMMMMIVLLQNVVRSASECGQERIQFWSSFVDLYYQTYGGSVR